jgi:hypothetical protein
MLKTINMSIKKIKLAENIDRLQQIVAQNSKVSQNFCDEQLQINKIVSEFKERVEKSLSINEGRISYLHSQSDKTKSLVSKLTDLAETKSIAFNDLTKEVSGIKELLSLMVKALKLELKVTPATERKVEIVIKSKKK